MPKLNARSLANSLVILALTIPSTRAFAQQSPGDPSTSTTITSSGYGASGQLHPNQQLMHFGHGSGISKPKMLYSPAPTYSDEARAARISGLVEVYLWVDKNGNPSHIRVVHGVGYGLDEKAIEVIRQSRFKPAMLNGQPVTVDLYIAVNFQDVQ